MHIIKLSENEYDNISSLSFKVHEKASEIIEKEGLKDQLVLIPENLNIINKKKVKKLFLDD